MDLQYITYEDIYSKFEYDSTDGSEFGERKYSSNFQQNDEETFIIDVCPKKKIFQSQEEKQIYVCEYSKKLKTELCKNFKVTKHCKFGDTCSFAHGEEQLQKKKHLHNNYKTKPCKNFFVQGFCFYGFRCQYLHMDIFKKPQFRDFLTRIYKQKKMHLPPPDVQNHQIKRFQRLGKIVKKQYPSFEDEQIVLGVQKRLAVFKDVCEVKFSSPFESFIQNENGSENSVQRDESYEFISQLGNDAIWESFDQHNNSFFSFRENETELNQMYQYFY